jgi:Zn-dependent protease
MCLEFSVLVLQTGEGQAVIFKFFLMKKLLLLPLSHFVTTRRSFWKKIRILERIFILTFNLVHYNNDVENVTAVHNIFFLAKM